MLWSFEAVPELGFKHSTASTLIAGLKPQPTRHGQWAGLKIFHKLKKMKASRSIEEGYSCFCAWSSLCDRHLFMVRPERCAQHSVRKMAHLSPGLPQRIRGFGASCSPETSLLLRLPRANEAAKDTWSICRRRCGCCCGEDCFAASRT